MNLKQILMKAGAAVVRDVIPGGEAVIEIVNEFLPEERKLDVGATGNDVNSAIAALPPEQRLSLFSKELDVEIAAVESWTAIQRALCEADSRGGSTRPTIARWMAQAIVFEIILFTSIWTIAIYKGDAAALAMLAESWELMLALLATPTALLRAYFGMRTEEKTARYSAAAGQPRTNFIADIVKAFKK